MAHWDMCNASGPSQTCVLPECFCRLALSDCHSQVPLESRHVLPRVPFTFLEIVGSAMSPDPTASSSCPPPPRQPPRTPNPRWEIDARKSLIVAGSNAGIGHCPLPCWLWHGRSPPLPSLLGPWPLALYQAVLYFFSHGSQSILRLCKPLPNAVTTFTEARAWSVDATSPGRSQTWNIPTSHCGTGPGLRACCSRSCVQIRQVV